MPSTSDWNDWTRSTLAEFNKRMQVQQQAQAQAQMQAQQAQQMQAVTPQSAMGNVQPMQSNIQHMQYGGIVEDDPNAENKRELGSFTPTPIAGDTRTTNEQELGYFQSGARKAVYDPMEGGFDKGVAGAVSGFMHTMVNPQAENTRKRHTIGTMGDDGFIHYQEGGVVPGHGEGDKVDIKAEPGEPVIPNEIADMTVRDLFSGVININKAMKGKAAMGGGQPHMQEGGIIEDPEDKKLSYPQEKAIVTGNYGTLQPERPIVQFDEAIKPESAVAQPTAKVTPTPQEDKSMFEGLIGVDPHKREDAVQAAADQGHTFTNKDLTAIYGKRDTGEEGGVKSPIETVQGSIKSAQEDLSKLYKHVQSYPNDRVALGALGIKEREFENLQKTYTEMFKAQNRINPKVITKNEEGEAVYAYQDGTPSDVKAYQKPEKAAKVSTAEKLWSDATESLKSAGVNEPSLEQVYKKMNELKQTGKPNKGDKVSETIKNFFGNQGGASVNSTGQPHLTWDQFYSAAKSKGSKLKDDQLREAYKERYGG